MYHSSQYPNVNGPPTSSGAAQPTPSSAFDSVPSSNSAVMPEGVPWSSNAPPNIPNSTNRVMNSDRLPQPNSSGYHHFPPPNPACAPGLNHFRQQVPGTPPFPNQTIAPGVRMPPQPVSQNSGGPMPPGSFPPGVSPPSALPSFPTMPSSVFPSQHVSNSPHTPSTTSSSGSRPMPQPPFMPPASTSSATPSGPGAPNASHFQPGMHPSGDYMNSRQLSHPSTMPNRAPSSNDASPIPPAGGLPLPFNGMAQYTHAIRQDGSHESSGTATPTQGNQRSYQPSPVSTPQIDAIEGQFSSQRSGMSQPPQPPTNIQQPALNSGGISKTGSGIFPPSQPLQPPQASLPPGYHTQPGQSSYQAGPPPPLPPGQPAPHQPGPRPVFSGPPMPPQPPSFQRPPGGPPSAPFPPSIPSQQRPLPGQFQRPPLPPGRAPDADQHQLPPSSTTYNQIPTSSQIGPPSVPGPHSLRPPSGPTQGSYSLSNSTSSTTSLQSSFSKLNLGPNRIVNLLQERVLIPPSGLEVTKPHFGSEYRDHTANCAPEIMRLTLNSLPHTSNLLNKARLPLGLHLHPFRDLSTIPVIQASVIVRCKSCRTYINPFVVFLDQRRWRCNICFRQNEVPNEFQFDPISRQYGDPQRRPEVKSATVEFIAPSEYMLRPPQPAVYLFVLDVSRQALSTGYLPLFCHTLLDSLDRLPGDSRTHIGLVTYDAGLHFYKLDEERGPRMLLVNDIDDVFLPDPSGLVVNLAQHRETVEDLLNNLPDSFPVEAGIPGNCMGAALQAALKLVGPTGGRVTVVNLGLPDRGPGMLKAREDPNQRAALKSVAHLGPATDFYKSLALECAGQQVAVDLFLLTNAYADFATTMGISRHSGGSVRFYPGFGDGNNLEISRFRADLRRYLSRKIGFEAVMRVRCTRGLAITAFYGNFFVRSTDLLSLPNVSPDAGYTIQLKIEDSLNDLASISFQAALLYTSSKGERRIRVHTLTVPTTGSLEEVFRNADHTAVATLLAKMAADRSVESGIREAREALINAVLDVLKSYGDACLSSAQRIGSLALPYNLRMLPLLVLSLLKSRAYRLGVSTKLDDRVAAMEAFKSLPPTYLTSLIYSHMYAVHVLVEENGPDRPPQLHASAQFTERSGAFLIDSGEYLYLSVGSNVPQRFLQDVFGVTDYSALPDGATELPVLETLASERLRNFIDTLRDERPIGLALLIVREDSRHRARIIDAMVDDRNDQLMAYTEFLQYLQSHVKYSS